MDAERNEETKVETGIGYKVFYSDSEDIAKMLAMSHIRENIHQDEKPVERPQIAFGSYLKGVILPVVLYAVITVFMVLFQKSITFWPFLVNYLLVFFFTVKPFVILLVLLYQKLAPERVRRSCCFEPTCSNYMLLAIEKYGFWKGFFKGLHRLTRCHYPNGGVDNP